MKRIIISVLVLGVCLTPLTVPVMVQPSSGQSQNLQVEELKQLLEKAQQQTQKGEHQQAIESFQKVLTIARQFEALEVQAVALLGIGQNYDKIKQYQQALDYLKQALDIFNSINSGIVSVSISVTMNNLISQGNDKEAVDYLNKEIIRDSSNRLVKAATLKLIGEIYQTIGQPLQALDYYDLALPILRYINDTSIKATTLSAEANILNNMGIIYMLSKPEKASEYFNQGLEILRKIKDRKGEAAALSNIGNSYLAIGELQKAMEYFNKALPIVKEVGDRSGLATVLISIGRLYDDLGQWQKGLEFFTQGLEFFRELKDEFSEARTINNIAGVLLELKQYPQALLIYDRALEIHRKVNDREGVAGVLVSIGKVYSDFGESQKALDLYNQALEIFKDIGNRDGEATTLNNIGIVYNDIGQPQKAWEFYNQSLLIKREMGDRSGEAATLSNIGAVYRDMNKPIDAIKNYEQSVNITLEIRSGLQQEYRQKYLKSVGYRPISLTSLLIDQNQADRAFQWVNLTTTADLADYTRLINAKVANPQAQTAIDEWNLKNQQLQLLRRQLEDKFSDNLSRQMRELDTEVNRKAEEISRQFPEVAELFETTPKDIAQLKASIAPDTVVIQPVLLTNVKSVPNTIALFVLTKDSLSVKKIAIDPAEFDKLLTEHREEISNYLISDYKETGGKLYDILIRPIEDQIQALSPKQLSIIATGKLRYIPFETLWDTKNRKFLIQKYPVNYLTRISTRSIPNSTLQGGVLALGNPIPPVPQNLSGSEEEVRNIAQLFPGSSAYIGNAATLDQFKTQAPRFPFLHLATHGCFQQGGCQKLGMEENTLLFADSQFNIRDAALLGLQNTRLLTLSACQTAMQANSNGEEISGVAYIFERAGARAVMASLWSVDDAATKDLMVEFYQNINKGMSKNEALRQAKLSQIGRHPFYWSPFILIGDGR